MTNTALKGIFKFMLVCLCHPLSDSELEKLVEDGADSVEEIGRRCGAGTSCGSCVGELSDAIAKCEMASDGINVNGNSLANRMARGIAQVRAHCSTQLVSLKSRPQPG